MTLSDDTVRWLTRLRVNTFRGEPRPLKPVLLLAVIELAEAGRLATNAVRFDPTLFELFDAYWGAVTDEPRARIQYPYWHLDSEPFWHLVARPGFEHTTANKRSSPSAKQVRERIQFARLAPELFEAMQDADSRDRMRGVLVSEYFPERAEPVAAIRAFEQSVYRYTQIIRRVGEPGAAEPAPRFVRDAAFRRVVTEAYGYTCAVSGARLTLSTGSGTYQLVQAAHIRDWSDSHDDDPRNGISLSGDYHWMFERGLFTLDERWRVRVSPVARECAGTVDALLTRYRGQAIRLPDDETLRPGQDYLDWHRREKYLAA